MFEKTFSSKETSHGVYQSFFDGKYFKENQLVNSQNFSLVLGLYIDEFEVVNPLGTSRKKHKLTAVYWVILNWPSQNRSSLNSIQLVLLGKSSEVKANGFEAFFYPFIRDLQSLEQDGIFVQRLGENVRGTAFTVSADNLGAHGLAGFQESFRVEKFCRFCLASLSDIQNTEVRQGLFQLRSQEQHDRCIAELTSSTETIMSVDGVKSECVLQKHLKFFHTISGFPPDLMHDLFEGIVPFEKSMSAEMDTS